MKLLVDKKSWVSRSGKAGRAAGEDTRGDVGRRGESRAAQYYVGRGFKILERNARTRSGELDLVVLDAAERRLVFVEVRTVSRGGWVAPEQTVREGKQRRVERQARLWLEAHPEYVGGFMVCFDVVGIVLETGALEHLPCAFEARGF